MFDPPKNFADMLRRWEQVTQGFEFLNQLKRLKVITTAGETTLLSAVNAENSVIDLRDVTATGEQPANELPDQTGHANKALFTTGAIPFWGVAATLPSQAGNASKFLQTNGATTLWAVPPPGASHYTEVKRVANQSAANSTTAPISFDTVVENGSGVWSAGSPTRITVPAGGAGIWQGSFWVYYSEVNTSGIREVGVIKNGSTFHFTDDRIPLPANGTSFLISFVMKLNVGDYLEAYCWQNSGGARTFQCQSATFCRIGL